MKKPPDAVEVFLAPGEFRFETGSTRLRTILGSCVAITWWHPLRKIGGMCHFMLPSRLRKSTELDGKYADEAFELFVRKAKTYQTQPGDYQMKLFGGGEMFPERRRDSSYSDIAGMNVIAARQLAANYHLDLVAHDMGSTGHRNIIFDLWSGHVWVRHKPMKIIAEGADEKNKGSGRR